MPSVPISLNVGDFAKSVEWRNELKSRGVVSDDEKRGACGYALQQGFCWLTDPGGKRWEVEDIDSMDEKTRVTSCAR